MKIIKRKCVVCGKNLAISLNKKEYSGGNYYGRLNLPVGRGKWVKIKPNKLFEKETHIVRWTGKEKEVEYWECDSCNFARA